jgi:hypothetical protein
VISNPHVASHSGHVLKCVPSTLFTVSLFDSAEEAID